MNRNSAPEQHELARCCKKCTEMFSTLEGLRNLVSSTGFEHYNMYDFLNSIQDGCELCSLVGDLMIIDRDSKKPFDVLIFRARRSEELPAGSRAERLEYPFKSFALEGVQFSNPQWAKMNTRDWLGLYAQANDPAAKYVKERPVENELNGPAAIQASQQWLNECREHHQACPRQENNSLPSRVLDLGQQNRQLSSIRLHISKIGERGDYTALSYSWGGPQHHSTTRDRLATYIENIDTTLLPATIQDAIIVTKQLGFRYLWIDSYCIVQDDEGDRARELSKMHLTYKNAAITIAAANTTSVHQSFLAPRKPINHIKLRMYVPQSSSGTIHIVKQDPFNPPLEPLESRGWTLQEDVLSSRLLIYGTLELLWRCDTLQKKTPMELASYIYYHSTVSQSSKLIKNVRKAHQKPVSYPNKSLADQIECWSWVINAFSARRLSFASDRLPALAGITSELRSSWDDTYLAGLWRRSLVYGLCWRRDNEKGRGRISPDEPSTTPSWSWVTVNGAIYMPRNAPGSRDMMFPLAKVQECTIELARSDIPLGTVKAGRLVLFAQLRDAKDFALPQARHDIFTSLYGDREELQIQDPTLYFLRLGCLHDIKTRLTRRLEDRPDPKDSVGLVLRKREAGDYERVGFFDDRSFGDHDAWADVPKHLVVIT